MNHYHYLLTREEEHRLAVRLATLLYDLPNTRAVLMQRIVPDEEGARPLNLVPSLNALNLEHDDPTRRWKKIYRAIPSWEVAIFLDYLLTQTPFGQGDPLLKSMLSVVIDREKTKVRQLAEAINEGKCLLFLGPGVLRNNVGEPFNQLLAKNFAARLDAKEIYYDADQDDNLAYIAQRYDEISRMKYGNSLGTDSRSAFKAENYNDQGWLAKTFYDSQESAWRNSATLYQLVAKFNFPLIITTNPDYQALLEEIDQHGVSRGIHAYYSLANGNHNPGGNSTEDGFSIKNEQKAQEERVQEWLEPIRVGQKQKVLLYNLLGSFENPASVLTAERQLLAFTTRVVKDGPPLPRPLTDLFLDPKHYLFLGFDFDQWFVRLIFDTVLKLDRTPDRSVSIYPNQQKMSFNQSNREFFEKVFNMYFVNNELQHFLEKLAEECGIET